MSTHEESNDANCDFCQIVRGEQAAQIVAESNDWVAFFPLEPATLGHTLVVPREHVTDFWQSNERINESLAGACRRIGRAIDTALQPDGMNLITSAGEAAEQTVMHLHLHVVPRWGDDGFGKIWPDKDASSGHDMAELAQRIGRYITRMEDAK